MFVSLASGGWAVLGPDGAVSGARLLSGRVPGLRALLEAGLMPAARDEAAGLAPDLDPAGLALAPTIPDPAHVFCAGLNYADHAAETGQAAPEAPRIFLRANSSLIGHGAAVLRPACSNDLDFEGELAVVIGTRAHRISEDAAMAHVAGYTCFMDGSVRDWQKASVTTGKNFVATGAMGPGLVPADAVPDWRALSLVTRVNGAEVQRVTLDRMIHTIPVLIAFLSQMTPLLPGDVIVTGTPEGIGCRRTPPLWLCPGDVVEVEVSGVGLLRNPVAQG
jgi:2-keto-4-pentenoate hydratase/2-oxohepta-3-ene-1,7-dioic acid hydratase in catechol pathway